MTAPCTIHGTAWPEHDRHVHVVQDGRPMVRLPLCLSVANHSPTGFAWGYGGSGPAQLALALLCHVVGAAKARTLYQEFKWDVVAKWPQDEDWTVTSDEVLAWVERHERRAITD